jgi:hypothetical protein
MFFRVCIHSSPTLIVGDSLKMVSHAHATVFFQKSQVLVLFSVLCLLLVDCSRYCNAVVTLCVTCIGC